MNYQEEYEQSIESPELFWQRQAQNIQWFKKPSNILSTNKESIHQWFADGELNTCYLALDYHVEQGRGDNIALIYDSPVTNTKQKFTYKQLTDDVAKFAGILRS